MRSLALLFVAASLASAAPKKIVLIAGPKDAGHPAGTHEYEKTVRAFKHCLDNAANVKDLRVEVHLKGWPEKPATLDDADTIVLVASGSDRNPKDHPFLVGDRLKVIEKQMRRGCGLCLIHWCTFWPKDGGGEQALEWVGGYFDYESGPAKNGWYSKIQTVTTKAVPSKHAITSGIGPFEIKDEFYYRMRFRERDPRLTPILSVPLEGEQTVAWAVERTEGGRGFGITGGHFFDNWKDENYRKMALNAILWTAKADIPAEGVKSDFPGEREIGLVTVGNPSQVLIVTGHDGPFHDWRETSQVLKHVIERDGRLKCRIVTDPEFLGREDLLAYDLIVQNYVNWEKPGLGEASKNALLKYLESGRGLAVIHFANGAFHPSLPKAAEGDWPEYRKIVRRVWDHGKGLSGHDAYGKFAVEIGEPHAITEGMHAFETVDELYYRQQGDESLKPLVTAKSKDTGKSEPLAWAYEYGNARVFQTVLGHSAESIRGDGPATLIRRGAAWAAGRELSPEKGTAKTVEKRLAFADGKFGKALDARVLPASIEGDDRYRKPPFTIECWAKLHSKSGFNVLVSSDPKTSGQHWEIYTYAGQGDFSAYLPGTTQGEIRSGVDVCDGKWHHLAMTNDGKSLTLFVDGKNVKQSPLAFRVDAKAIGGPLVIGGAYTGDQRIGCDGLVDDVRFTKGVREIKLPSEALKRDADTVGLWSLDGDEGISADANWTPPTPTVAGEWWQKETDKDWVDGRFAKMDTGPFLNATIDYEGPKGKVRSYKATAIKVGEKGEATVLFDRNRLRFAAAWTGSFLQHSSRRFGLLNTPTPDGKMFVTTSELPGWMNDDEEFDAKMPPTGPLPRDWAAFKGMRMAGRNIVLDYSVNGTDVSEMYSLPATAKKRVISRTIKVGKSPKSLRCLVMDTGDKSRRVDFLKDWIAAIQFGDHALWATVKGPVSLEQDDKGRVYLLFSAGNTPVEVTIQYWQSKSLDDAESGDVTQLEHPGIPPVDSGERKWPQAISTRVERGTDAGPLAVDSLPLPFDNPYKALLYVTGVDFLPDGRIAICTAHGDVWTAKEKGDVVEWRRFATGMYQPLGLKVVDGKVVVLERGQLTRLHDTNNDGEADFYECVNNDWHTGGGEHSYDTCLETDPQGNFYFFKTGDDHTPTGGTLIRVSKDGSKSEVFCTGFRHPIGMGMSPDGKLTGADQEGNWMPVTRLDVYKQGGFYGDMRCHHRKTPPTTFDPPLLWLPKEADNSAGGQVWVPKDQWGPLGGKMLHLSYGQCKAYAILPDGEKFQAGAVDLGLRFLSGSARGRFNPIDKHLYVVGLDGWQTAAKADGSLQRVRYTGKPFAQPVGYEVLPDGVRLTFDQELMAADAKDMKVTRCNYRWSGEYGSKNWSVLDPNKEGLDTVPVTKATVSGKSLTLTFDIRPAMHMKVEYSVLTPSGERNGAVYTTIQPPS